MMALRAFLSLGESMRLSRMDPQEAGLAEREASPLRSPFPEVPQVGLEEAAEKGA